MLDKLSNTIDLGEKLVSLFKSLKGKLWGDTNKAYDKLKDAIDEIRKFYEVTGNELSNFQSLDFADAAKKQDNMKALYDIQAGMLQVRIEDARGHCHQIKLIYDEYLDKWFKSALAPDEFEKMKQLFWDLSIFDDSMFEATVELESDLQTKSLALLQFLNANEPDKATAYQMQNNMDLLKARKQINQLLTELVSLRNEFMQSAAII